MYRPLYESNNLGLPKSAIPVSERGVHASLRRRVAGSTLVDRVTSLIRNNPPEAYRGTSLVRNNPPS